MAEFRIVKYGEIYQVQQKWKPWFCKERWVTMDKWFEGPPANFDSIDEAIKFAKSWYSGDGGEVVWSA